MTDGPPNGSKSPEKPLPGHEFLTVVDWATDAASSASHETVDLVRDHPVVAISAGLYCALLFSGKGGFAKSGAALLAKVDDAAKDEKLVSGVAHGATADSLPSLKIEGDHLLAKNQTLEPTPRFVHVSNTPDLTTLHDVEPGLDEKPNGLWYSPDHAWAKRSDWSKVKADYDGIQFENVENDHALPRWYRGLDVDSGSIWNASKVELTPLGEMPPTEFEFDANYENYENLLNEQLKVCDKT